MPQKLRYLFLLPLLSGFLASFSWQSDFLFWIQLIAYVPLFYSLYILKNSSLTFWKKVGANFLIVSVFKITFTAIATDWMIDISVSLLVAYAISKILIFGSLMCLLFIRRMPFFAVTSLFIIYEFINQNLIIQTPFYLLGFGWGNRIELIQYYSILGVEGGSWLLILMNFAFTSLLIFRKITWKEYSIIGVFICCSIFSIAKFYTEDETLRMKDVSINLIHAYMDTKVDSLIKNPEILANKIHEISKENSLVILPEVFYNSLGWQNNLSQTPIIHYIDSLRETKNQTYLLGAYVYSQVSDDSPQTRRLDGYDVLYNTHNVSILLSDRIGLKSKQVFIPFQEFVPNNFVFQTINNWISNVGDDRKISPLDIDEQFQYKNRNFNVLICYESLYPTLVQKRAEGNDFLIIQASEEWNESEKCSNQYLNTHKPIAIQTGLPIYRVSNHGFSGEISPKGEDRMYFDIKNELTSYQFDLLESNGNTFYSIIKNYSYLINFLILFIFCLLSGNFFVKKSL